MPTNTATIKIEVEVDGKTGIATIRQVGSESKEAGEVSRKAFGKSKKSLSDFNQTAIISTGLIKKMVAAFGLWKAIHFGQDIFETGKNIRSMTLAVQSATGSAQAAAREFDFVHKVSDELGQNFYALIDAYKGVLAASRGTALQGQATRDIFYGVAKAAATLGLSADTTQGMLLAIEQMMSKGTVQAEELRGQLGERLPGALNLAAKAMGMTTTQFNKMLNNGQVLAADLLPKLAHELSENYSGKVDASVRASNKFNEAWTDLKNTMAQSGFLDSISVSMNNISAVFRDDEFKRSMADFARNIGNIAEDMSRLVKYASLRSVTNTFKQGMDLSEQGRLDFEKFKSAGFLERQRMVDDALRKSAAPGTVFTGKIDHPSSGGGIAPGANISGTSGFSLSSSATKEINTLIQQGKELSDFWKLQADDHYEVQSRTYDLLIGKDKSASDKLIRQGKNLVDFWMLEANDRYEVQSRTVDLMVEKEKQANKTISDLTLRTSDSIEQTFSNLGFDSLTGKLNSFSEYWTATWQSMARVMSDVFGQQMAQGLFGKDYKGGGMLSALAEWIGISASAQGNIFRGPGIGRLENGIYDKPTFFTLARGAGVLAEAGRPEAVMPLVRTPTGDLGVQSSGGPISIEFNIDNSTGIPVEQKNVRIVRPSQSKIIANLELKRKLSGRQWSQ